MLGGGCNIPATATAYALNIAVIPPGPLGFLAAWPAGTTYPGTSTINDSEGGVIANAAIVPAGAGGNVAIVASDPTDVVIDISGYYAPASSVTPPPSTTAGISWGQGPPPTITCSPSQAFTGFYVRTDALTANATAYVCSQIALGLYAWELMQAPNSGVGLPPQSFPGYLVTSGGVASWAMMTSGGPMTPDQTATCDGGLFGYDVNFFYICVAPNTWAKIPLILMQ